MNRRLFADVEPTFVKRRQGDVDMRLSTSRPFFNQNSTLKQRREPAGLVSNDIPRSPATQSPVAPQPSISEEVRQPTEFSPQKRRSARIRQRPKHLVHYEVQYLDVLYF